MKEISSDSYERLIDGSEVLQSDDHGVKVYLLKNGMIGKLFRCKRTWSSAKIYPYAQRFADNSVSLRQLGFHTVKVDKVLKVPHIGRDLVIYQALVGQVLREVFQETSDAKKLIDEFINYIIELHNKGVYFRSLHFANILALPQGGFGLIDVSDMKISRSPLMTFKRVRNFKAMLRHRQDKQFLQDYGLRNFFNTYIRKAGLSPMVFYTILKTQKRHPALKLLFTEGR